MIIVGFMELGSSGGSGRRKKYFVKIRPAFPDIPDIWLCFLLDQNGERCYKYIEQKFPNVSQDEVIGLISQPQHTWRRMGTGITVKLMNNGKG